MLIMKRYFLYFVIMFIPAACIAKDYHEIARDCDKVAEEKQKNAVSTVQMVQIVDGQKNCYEALVYKIIDTEYTKNKQQMKSEFDSFIKKSSDIAYSAQYPDICTPDCGTIVGLNAANTTLEIIKTYVQQLLEIVSPK